MPGAQPGYPAKPVPGGHRTAVGGRVFTDLLFAHEFLVHGFTDPVDNQIVLKMI